MINDGAEIADLLEVHRETEYNCTLESLRII
jgi:hypothetical protein